MDNSPQQPQNDQKKISRYVFIVGAIVVLIAIGVMAFVLRTDKKTSVPPDYKPVSAVVGTDIPVGIQTDGVSVYFEHNGERLSLANKITDLMVGTEYAFTFTNNSGVKQGVFVPALKESIVVETGQTGTIYLRFTNPGTYYFMGNVYQPGWDGLRSGFDVGMDTIEPPPITASAGTATPTPTPTSSTGTCQCDLSVVMENNCVAPAVPVCQSQMVCVCNAFVGAEPTSTVTPTPTMTSTPTPTPTPTVSPTPTTGAGGAFTSCADVTEIPQAECQALVDLYNSTNGPGWTNSWYWLETNRPCSSPWYRVTCSNGHVIQLMLNSNQLYGSIPVSVGALTELIDLNLDYNQIDGTIPESIGNLVHLRLMNLNNNQLSGSVPHTLGNLTNLTYLLLYKNKLTGEIPASIGNLSSLRELNLKDNLLSGNIPTSLGNLTNLLDLGLDFNRLTGNIPSLLSQLTQLRTLHLASNQLTGTVPANLANLTAISNMNVTLGTNSLTGVENQSVCPWLAAHSASNWWQVQTPPIASDPCASTGIEEAQPVAARSTGSTKPNTMPAANQNIFMQIALFFQQLLNNTFGGK